MKRLSLLMVMLIMLGAAWAGINESYTFLSTVGTYTPITGTPIPAIHVDDAISAAIPIGFTFPYGNLTYTEVRISSNGWVGLGATLTSSNLTNLLASTTVRPVVAPLWDDLNMNAGTVQYATAGTAPNRIFTVQYANAKWNFQATNGFNFQVKLHENGKIELVYGSFTGTPLNASASIGINMAPGGTGWFYSVTPVPPATVSMTTENLSIATFPAQGTVYEFNPVVPVNNDLAALTVTGNTTPTQGQAATYTVSVRNSGAMAQNIYQVKLFRQGDVEIGSVAGTAIAPNEVLTFAFSWAPTAVGQTFIYGKVMLTGDESPTNDQTPNLIINVFQSGLTEITIGTGIDVNTPTGSPTPYGTYFKAFRQQYLYLASDIINNGGAPGAITGIAYNVQALNTCVESPNFRIRLKNTTLTALTTTFEVGDYTTVWTHPNFLPAVGWNLHPFSAPFIWDGVSNIIVELVTDMIPGNWTQNASVFFTATTGVNTALRFHSDTVNGATGTTGTLSVNRANTRFFMQIGGMGSMSGVVNGPGAMPLAGATVTVEETVFSATTNTNGQYNIPFLPIGNHQVTASKHGYHDQTLPALIVENQNTTLNFTLTQLPNVQVTGTVVGSDQPTVGLAGATVTLTGYQNYNAVTNAAGAFTITGVYSGHTYNYTINQPGYQPATGTVQVGTTNVNMGTITLNELAFPPINVQAEQAQNNTVVNVTWLPPDPTAIDISEGFEEAFPPADWTQVITNTGAAGTIGVYPTWCRFGTVALTPPVPPHGGSWQAGLWWAETHQDEWLITPEFVCPPNANLTFWSYAFLGSTHQDHYYVKVSTNGGTTWTPLWDASALTGGWNYYAAPITVPLSAYTGQQIKLAWHATDGPTNDGLWYVWFIDDIFIGNPDTTVRFPLEAMTFRSASATPHFVAGYNLDIPMVNSRAKAANPDLVEPVLNVPEYRNEPRVLTGYKVWRLEQGQEQNEASWTLLTDAIITATAYTDGGWAQVPDGVYKWAVKAVYTGDVMSIPMLSNPITKITQIGTIAGIVRNLQQQPIQGATIAAGTYTATTNTSGAYSIQVPAGTYTVTANAPGYMTGTQPGIIVVTGQTTTANFILQVSSQVVVLQEGFEATTFPPTGWTRTITNTGAAGTSGVMPTWCRVGTVAMTPPIIPPEGTWQAGIWWAETHQDEWLITPQFVCPTNANLTFKTYAFRGSVNQDHYYVKVSTDNGQTWTPLWNASTLTGGWTIYSDVVTIPLADYAGQSIKLAWHAVDGPGNDGLWYVWFIDQVKVEGTVSNEDVTSPVVQTELHSNYPNPFNPETTIRYSVKEATHVTIEIYNVKGQLVRTLVNEAKSAGNHNVVWNGMDNSGRSISSGVYFYKMKAGAYSSTKKMILMK